MLDWGCFFVRPHADEGGCRSIAGRNVPLCLVSISPRILPLLLDYRKPSSHRGPCLLSREGGWCTADSAVLRMVQSIENDLARGVGGLREAHGGGGEADMRKVQMSITLVARRRKWDSPVCAVGGFASAVFVLELGWQVRGEPWSHGRLGGR